MTKTEKAALADSKRKQLARYSVSSRIEKKAQELASLNNVDSRREQKRLRERNYDRKVTKPGTVYRPSTKPHKAMKEGDSYSCRAKGKDDRSINSYFRSKNGDNLPRNK
ncbi:hypothetical protein [Vibrio phage vB_VpaP_G1]|uniref:Uncharacterized protein n=1 Tax=Vibrio phage vB_VpaP_G1 TaxID=2862773 RepID=A0AAE8BLG5_9CAUD|nr:hypothetical protein PP280_gp13 [Vibrio phage vB_VpaP_G1]QYW05813.1 hypothetical protein [Vibrio phage vB_VpaP_G1]